MQKNIRWVIVFLLFIATGLSFLDRQVLSIAIIKIQEEFHITDVQYGMINTSFLISYAIMFTLGGWLIDRLGGKLGLALSVGVWSIANSLHAITSSFSQLVTFRFFLGMGEGGCFPGAAWTVYRWFDKKRPCLSQWNRHRWIGYRRGGCSAVNDLAVGQLRLAGRLSNSRPDWCCLGNRLVINTMEKREHGI